jgi:hypothetical protein
MLLRDLHPRGCALAPLHSRKPTCTTCLRSRQLTASVVCKQQRRRAAAPKRNRREVDASTPKGFGQMLIDDDSIISLDRGLQMPDIPFYAAYTQPGYRPSRYLGPVELREVPGKGRALVATREVIMGDLMAVSLPLAFVENELGSAADTEELFAAMVEEDWSQQQRRLLGLLYDGSEQSMQQPMALEDLDAAGGGSGGSGGGGEAPPLDSERLRRVAESCAYGDDFQDPGCMQVRGVGEAAAAWRRRRLQVPAAGAQRAGPCPPQRRRRGGAACRPPAGRRPCTPSPLHHTPPQVRHQAPLGFLGLWPEFALLNHSCAPNVSVTVVKGAMLVHATDTLQPGDELATSYLGRAVMSPLQQRRQLLQDGYGFTCACPRCALGWGPAAAQGCAALGCAGLRWAMAAAQLCARCTAPPWSAVPGHAHVPPNTLTRPPTPHPLPPPPPAQVPAGGVASRRGAGAAAAAAQPGAGLGGRLLRRGVRRRPGVHTGAARGGLGAGGGAGGGAGPGARPGSGAAGAAQGGRVRRVRPAVPGG